MKEKSRERKVRRRRFERHVAARNEVNSIETGVLATFGLLFFLVLGVSLQIAKSSDTSLDRAFAESASQQSGKFRGAVTPVSPSQDGLLTLPSIQRITAANVIVTGNKKSLVNDFILNLKPDNAVLPVTLAKSLNCSYSLVLETASELGAHMSLVIDGEAAAYIAHPNTVVAYTSLALPAGYAEKAGEENMDFSIGSAAPGYSPRVPAELPSLNPNSSAGRPGFTGAASIPPIPPSFETSRASAMSSSRPSVK